MSGSLDLSNLAQQKSCSRQGPSCLRSPCFTQNDQEGDKRVFEVEVVSWSVGLCRKFAHFRHSLFKRPVLLSRGSVGTKEVSRRQGQSNVRAVSLPDMQTRYERHPHGARHAEVTSTAVHARSEGRGARCDALRRRLPSQRRRAEAYQGSPSGAPLSACARHGSSGLAGRQFIPLGHGV